MQKLKITSHPYPASQILTYAVADCELKNFCRGGKNKPNLVKFHRVAHNKAVVVSITTGFRNVLSMRHRGAGSLDNYYKHFKAR